MSNSPQNGRDYGALQANNPYRNYQYTPSFWDRIGNGINQFASEKLGLGPIFKTNQMRIADEMANAASVYDSQIAEVQREEMYNSASEQAQRMREAGVNPDLQASGITGGEASPFDNQAQSAMPSLEGSGDVQQVIGSLVQIPMTVASLASGFQDISSKATLLKEGRLQYMNHLGQTMQSWVVDHINQFDGISTQKDFLKSDLFNSFMNDPEVKSMFPEYWSRKEAAYAAFRQAKSMGTGTAINNLRGQFIGSENNPLNFDSELVNSIMTASAVLTSNKLKYDNEYFSTLDGEQAAKAENAQRTWIEMQNSAYKVLSEHFQNWYKQTGDIRAAFAVLQIEQLIAGNVDKAAAIVAAGNIPAISSQSSNSSPESPEPPGSEPETKPPLGPGSVHPPIVDKVEETLRGILGVPKTSSRLSHFKKGDKNHQSIKYPSARSVDYLKFHRKPSRLSPPTPDEVERRRQRDEYFEREEMYEEMWKNQPY